MFKIEDLKFKLLKNTGNKTVFESEDKFWKIWSYGPDEENKWFINQLSNQWVYTYNTFNEAEEAILKHINTHSTRQQAALKNQL